MKTDADPTAAMTPQQFEVWITTVCGLLLDKRQTPDAPRKALLARLRAGGYVTDASVIALIASAAAAEAPGTAPGTVTPAHLADTVGLIDMVLGLSYGRPELAAELHRRKAGLYEAAGDTPDAVREYAQATSLLTPLHVAVDQQRVDSLVQEAGLLTLMGDLHKAEPLYLEALSYDWYKVRDPEAMRSLRDLYVRAGRGLIDCRRGNLAALKEIYFVPSTLDELGPPLQKAIQEAEGVKVKPTVKPDPPSKQ